MSKNIVLGKDLREKIFSGVKKLAGAVKTTLGPSGRLVLIEQPYGGPKMTKDGVTVAKAVELPDGVENLAASFLKLAATQTVDKAGDGTTTAIVLAEEMFMQGLQAVVTGANAVEVKKGMEAAVDIVVNEIKSSKEVITGKREKIKQAATVSANGDENIGELIANAFEKVGNEGVITVEEGKGRETELVVVEGMNIDRGFISPYFATNTEKMICELENAHVLIYEKKISSAQSIVPLLQAVHQSGKSLLIIAEDLEGEALSTIVVNRLRGVLKVAAIKAPGFGDRRKEMCKDIAILTGATVVSEELGHTLENVKIDQLGLARKIIINANETTIVEGSGKSEDVKARCAQIRNQIADATSDYEKQKFEERLAKLSGGVAILKVGGTTEAEAKECKDRVDDAVQAIRAAIEEGIVPGGGVALLYARNSLDAALEKMPSGAKKIGFEVIFKALEAPLRVILSNAGREDFCVVLEKILAAQKEGKPNYGLDVRNDVYGDMINMGVIDPTKVVRSALQNALSVSTMLLTSEASISNLPKNEKESSMPGGMPGMGGEY